MTKINIEIDDKYKEALDLLKQVIPNEKWGEIKEDWEMVEALIDSFMAFIQQQAEHDHNHEWGCCGWWNAKSEWGHWSCWCSH